MSQRKGLKINNQASLIQPKIDTTAEFNAKANEAFSKYEEYKQRTLDLSTKFKAMMEDKVLFENKSILSKDMEKEIIEKLVQLSSDMNADENQPEGIGSVALSVLLMKMMLLQRDTINQLAFKLEKAIKPKA